MNSFRMRFVVGISDDEMLALKDGHPIISKMLLTPDDYRAFHYSEGEDIEAETPSGNRLWTTIHHMEVVEDDQRTIVILSLTHQQNDIESRQH